MSEAAPRAVRVQVPPAGQPAPFWTRWTVLGRRGQAEGEFGDPPSQRPTWFPTLGERRHLTVATRQVATLLAAGFPLDAALESTRRLVRAPRLGAALGDVQARVRSGSDLATALTAHGDVFSPLYRGLVAAGERVGRLGAAFERLADQLDGEAELRSRLLGALLYPAIMVVAGSGAIVMLLLFVLPRFVTLLAETGGALPLSARALQAAGAGLVSYGWLVALASLAAGVAIALQRRSPEGRLAQDRWLLSVPALGALRRRLATERVARTLSSALKGGVPLIEALEIAAGSATDAAFRQELERTIEAVRRGEPLSAQLDRGRVFPDLAVQMVVAGERGGRLVAMLEHVERAYRRESERQIATLVALVEPAVILAFGAIVTLIALALLQTLYGVGAGAL